MKYVRMSLSREKFNSVKAGPNKVTADMVTLASLLME